MKASKRIFALVLALVMVFSTCITSFAAVEPQGTGSLTVENALATHEYKIYKVFDLTYKTGDDLPKYENGKVVSPVTYKYFGSADNAKILDDGPFTATLVNGTTDANGNSVYNIVPDLSATDAEIISFISENAEKLGELKKTVVADSDEFTVTDLEYGYYYISTGTDSIVTIDSLIPNVTVVDKNEDVPSWDNTDDPNPDTPDADEPGNGKVIVLADDSKVTENSVNYGDKVNFSIAVNAKALTKDAVTGEYGLATYYYIKDELGKGFNAPTDITVNIYETDEYRNYPDIPTQTLTINEDYRLVQDGNKFSIRIPFGLKFGSEAKIEVTYSATVKDTDAVTLGQNGNLNTASFSYDVDEEYDPNTPSDKHYDPDPEDEDPDYPDPEHPYGDEDPEDPKDPTPDDVPDGDDPRTTTTYVYAIDILKYTGELTDPTKLADARFTLEKKVPNPDYDPDEPGDEEPLVLVPVYLKIDTEEDSEAVASFDYDKDGTAESSYGTEKNPIVTKKDGKILVKGLDEGTYVLTEIKAPDGYNLLTAPIEITLDKDSTEYKPLVTIKEAGDGQAEPASPSEALHKDVLNKSGVELPSTGGNGTGMFYLFGAILLAGGAVLLSTKKRIGAN